MAGDQLRDLEEDFTVLQDERGEDRRWEVWEPPTEYPENRVWTVVVYDNDDDSSSWYAMPGYHRVNREFFIVTEEPWTDPDKDYGY